jgi:hypothetical protein
VRGWTSYTGEFAGYVTSRLAGALAAALPADGVMGKSFGTARLVRSKKPVWLGDSSLRPARWAPDALYAAGSVTLSSKRRSSPGLPPLSNACSTNVTFPLRPMSTTVDDRVP